MIGRIWRPLLTLLLVLTGLVFFVFWLSAVIGAVFSYPYWSFVFPDHTFFLGLGIFNIIIIVGYLLFSLGMLLARLAYGTRLNKGWSTGLTIFWILNFVSLGFAGSRLAMAFQAESSISRAVTLEEMSSDTLHLQLERMDYQEFGPFGVSESVFSVDEIQYRDQYLWTDEVRLDIERAEGAQFVLSQENRSRGGNEAEARVLAGILGYDWKLEDNRLLLPEAFRLGEEEKWRVQEVDLTLQVPEGKYLRIGPDLYRLLGKVELESRDHRLWDRQEHLWRMQSGGLVCVDCEGAETKEPEPVGATELPEFENFRQLSIQGRLKVMIDHGDGYEVRLSGPSQYLREVNLSQEDERLIIRTETDATDSPVRLYLTLPELTSLEADATDDIRVRGFKQSTLSVKMTGAFELKLEGDIDTLHLRQDGPSEVNLRGAYDLIDASLQNRAHLDADEAQVGKAEVETDEGSRFSNDG